MIICLIFNLLIFQGHRISRPFPSASIIFRLRYLHLAYIFSLLFQTFFANGAMFYGLFCHITVPSSCQSLYVTYVWYDHAKLYDVFEAVCQEKL